MNTFKMAVGVLVIGFLVGCSTSQPKQKSNLTFSVVKSEIKKGVTTQAEILNILGSPNITTKSRNGDEIWTYSRQSFDSETGGYYGNLIVFGGNKAFSSSDSSTFDLIITFAKNDIVKDYSVISTQF